MMIKIGNLATAWLGGGVELGIQGAYKLNREDKMKSADGQIT